MAQGLCGGRSPPSPAQPPRLPYPPTHLKHAHPHIYTHAHPHTHPHTHTHPHIYTQALPYKEHILGVGLDSAEVGWPPALYKDVFAAAGELGLKRVAHAGEEGGPENVWSALRDLHVDRIDHGVHRFAGVWGGGWAGAWVAFVGGWVGGRLRGARSG